MKIPLVTKQSKPSELTGTTGWLALIDKPADWTSFDVCKKIRRITGVKKVGHGGTLDPFAVGLMTVGIGKGTKKLQELTALDKRYHAVIHIGHSTDSYDNTGTVTEAVSDFRLEQNDIEKHLSLFTGEIMQTPPMFSAKKVNGKRLYLSARKGVEVERKPVPVTVFSAEILAWNFPDLTVAYHVSKGTYIRVLAHELGRSLGVPAVLNALRRTAIGDFKVEQALSLKEFEQLWIQANS